MKIINIKELKDKNLGSLAFFESMNDIPFEIKRVYYIYHVPKGGERGGHAHKSLRQMLFCTYGKIEIILNDGYEKNSVLLDNPSQGLLIGEGIWRDMIWLQEESVLCVVASEYYDETDYIRNYDEFIRLVKEGYWKREN